MKAIGIILAILIGLILFILAVIIAKIGFDTILFNKYTTIGNVSQFIFAGYVGFDCYNYAEKFYKWFISNIK